MKSRMYTSKKRTREQTPDFSTAPAQPMFQSRSFVVQSKVGEQSIQQKSDLKTQLSRATRFGHNISKITAKKSQAETEQEKNAEMRPRVNDPPEQRKSEPRIQQRREQSGDRVQVQQKKDEAGNKKEQEAFRVASQVVQKRKRPETAGSLLESGIVQRKPEIEADRAKLLDQWVSEQGEDVKNKLNKERPSILEKWGKMSDKKEMINWLVNETYGENRNPIVTRGEVWQSLIGYAMSSKQYDISKFTFSDETHKYHVTISYDCIALPPLNVWTTNKLNDDQLLRKMLENVKPENRIHITQEASTPQGKTRHVYLGGNDGSGIAITQGWLTPIKDRLKQEEQNYLAALTAGVSNLRQKVHKRLGYNLYSA